MRGLPIWCRSLGCAGSEILGINYRETPDWGAKAKELTGGAGVDLVVEVGGAGTRKQSLHEAHHATMECLGEMIWQSQRSGLPPDGHQYLDCVRRRATLNPG